MRAIAGVASWCGIPVGHRGAVPWCGIVVRYPGAVPSTRGVPNRFSTGFVPFPVPKPVYKPVIEPVSK